MATLRGFLKFNPLAVHEDRRARPIVHVAASANPICGPIATAPCHHIRPSPQPRFEEAKYSTNPALLASMGTGILKLGLLQYQHSSTSTNGFAANCCSSPFRVLSPTKVWTALLFVFTNIKTRVGMITAGMYLFSSLLRAW